MSDGSEKPIAFASTTLNLSEQKYSQIEKEALSIIFSVNKFYQYLYGTLFTLRTDHKPLVSIFHPEKGIPQFSANRLRRWAIILSNFQYKIQFVSSQNNVAELFSRLPIVESHTFVESVDINFISYFKQNVHFPIDFIKIKKATSKDRILKIIL